MGQLFVVCSSLVDDYSCLILCGKFLYMPWYHYHGICRYGRYRNKNFASFVHKGNVQISDSCPQSQIVCVLKITLCAISMAFVMEAVLCQYIW